MLISETVMVRWNGSTRKWYESRGYSWTKQNELFECNIADVQKESTAKVIVKCDYNHHGCKNEFEKEFRRYNREREIVQQDCCKNRNCMTQKSKEVNIKLYGVDNATKLDSRKEEMRKRLQTPFSEVRKGFEEKGLQLLSEESDYQNDRSRLFFICNNHRDNGIQETNYANIKKNKGCCNYGRGELCAEARRLDGEIVYQAFVDKQLIPMFNPIDYKKNNQRLQFICPDHKDKGVQKTNYATLMSTPHKCYYCGKDSTAEQLRHKESFIFNYFKDRGLIVIDGQSYKDQNTHIKFECSSHLGTIQKVTYHSLTKTKQPCELCRAEDSLRKLNKRLRSSITLWKKQSELNCGKQCIFTGIKEYEVHHLQPFGEIIKEALDELGYDVKDKYTGEEYINIKDRVIKLHDKYPLGVCISNRIHVLFHQLYSKEATIQDFYEFKHRYELGEFNELLKEVS